MNGKKDKSHHWRDETVFKTLLFVCGFLLVSVAGLTGLNYFEYSNYTQNLASANEVTNPENPGGRFDDFKPQPVTTSTSTNSSSTASSATSSATSASGSSSSSSTSTTTSGNSSNSSSSSNNNSNGSGANTPVVDKPMELTGGTVEEITLKPATGTNSNPSSNSTSTINNSGTPQTNNGFNNQTVEQTQTAAETNPTVRTGGLQITLTVLGLTGIAVFIYYYRKQHGQKSSLKTAEKKLK